MGSGPVLLGGRAGHSNRRIHLSRARWQRRRGLVRINTMVLRTVRPERRGLRRRPKNRQRRDRQRKRRHSGLGLVDSSQGKRTQRRTDFRYPGTAQPTIRRGIAGLGGLRLRIPLAGPDPAQARTSHTSGDRGEPQPGHTIGPLRDSFYTACEHGLGGHTRPSHR